MKKGIGMMNQVNSTEKVDKFIIPSGALKVLNVLKASDFEAWLVGGCVRDHLMGLPPRDFDVATNATADRVIASFEGFRVIETGLKHGTVTVLSDGIPVEVTTYRVDGEYSDGRHPDSVEFTSDIRDDLSRRDFTVNAMAYSPEKGYLDYFGGRDDLSNQIIRCVGDPDRRFGEDALRILRALRFASRLGFEIEPATAQAIHRCRGLLAKIAVERITQELFGLLCGSHAGDVMRQFSDVIEQIIPPIGKTFGFEQHNPHHGFDVWEHTLRVVDAAPPDRIMRLAALLHDIGKPDCFSMDSNGIGHFYGHAARSREMAEGIFDQYIRTDNRTKERVLFLVERHDEKILPDRRFIRRRLSKYGEEATRQLFALSRADLAGQAQSLAGEILSVLDEAEKILDELVGESLCLTLRDLAINGGDLMAMGIPKGPEIGRILNALLAEVCEETLCNSSDALRKRAAALAGL